MIQNMTAYEKHIFHNKFINITWEIRSTNHRYLEICVHLPDNFYFIEQDIRKRLSNFVKRGKVDCYLKLDFDDINNHLNTLKINKKIFFNILDILKFLKKNIGLDYNYQINLFDIIKWPGFIDNKKKNIFNKIYNDLIQSLDKAILNFIEDRKRTGKKIKYFIEKKIENIKKEINLIEKYIPQIILWEKNRIIKKFKEHNLNIEKNRLEQEILLLMYKLDISEEIDRLKLYIEDTLFSLNHRKEFIGKRLNFIMQELHRESNTLISKSMHLKIKNYVIEIKVLIEQIREQIQNIE